MTLRSKATLIVGTSFLALIGLLLAAAIVVVLGRFRLLEAEEADRNVRRALDALNDQAVNLAATAADWAHWDDSAAFVAGRNPGFPGANLVDDTFLTLRLDVVAFLGPGGRVVYQRVYDRAGHHDSPPLRGFAEMIAPGSPLVAHAEAASHVEGLVVLPGAILLAASQPVTDSLRRQPASGVLVFARILDRVEVKRLSGLLQLDMRLSRLDEAGLTARQIAEAAAGEPQSVIVTPGADRIVSILPVRDVAGKVVAALHVQSARRAYRHGLLSVLYLGGSLVAFSVLSAVLLFVLLSRMVLSPLSGLSRAVRGIGAGGGADRLAAQGRDELSEVANSINGMLDALARSETRRAYLEERLSHVHKLEAIGTLAGGVAHDFNNILMAITGFCEVLEDGRSAAGERADGLTEIKEIHRAAMRAASLTSQLLAFSRRQRLQFQVLDLNALLSDMAGMLRRLLGEHLALELSLEPSLARIRGDFGQLQQVIMNLAVNARDAMPGGGTLTICTSTVTIVDREESERIGLPAGAYVRCSMRDTGVGMQEEVLKRIFEPFFTTKELGSGTGLGLSVVWGIVKQCDGTICVTSTPGQGSTFEIYLPVTVQEAAQAAEHAAAPPAACAEPGRGKVLVVEDEPAIRTLLCRALRKAGYCVLEASDGEEALALAAEHGADGIRLLLTDVVMPRMGGAALARVLQGKHPGLKVLYMSGNAELQGAAEAPAAVLPLLQKPFNTRQLFQSVAAVLGN